MRDDLSELSRATPCRHGATRGTIRGSGVAALLLLALAFGWWAAAPLRGQTPAPASPEEDPSLEDFRAFQTWLRAYTDGAFRLAKHGEDDPEALAEVDRILGALAKWNTLPAAQQLFRAAVVDPKLPSTQDSVEQVTFFREMQPWRVRALARARIAAMACDGLDDWLLSHLRDAFAQPDAVPALTRDAAMRIVAQRGDGPGLAELMKASLSLPKDQRAGAVQALSQLATLSLVPHFVGLLNDSEPNVRIAALNAIGKALGPYTDETIATDAGGAGDNGGADPEVGRSCDLALAKMRELLVRDRIWQVRAAAAENLFALRMRRVIPILIDGLEAELKREKDPWAMDVRLHRLLERITGQKMLLGQVEEWKRFWRDEGPSMRLTASTELAAETKQATATGKRVYEKFFNIEIESDRLLFVIDFSGSMTEVITLKTRGTAAAPGTPLTKAKLVVEELKKIITSLPDGTLFNIIVFSEEVRVWRTQSDGRPSLVRLDDETRDDLLGSYLDALQPAGATNLYGALKTALAFGGRGLFDKYYEAGFDTLYVMSDGAPTWGEVVDTEEILRMVREGNALRRFAIHTVTFGDLNEMRFLQDLAAQNGGRHIHVE